LVLAPVVTPPSQQSYNLSITDKLTKCTASDSVTVFIITEVEVPNAFSPNGDGVHDVWQIGGLAGYVNASLEVYNRYGQLVFASKNGYTNPWDGTYQGKPVPFGTYYYVLDLKNGKPILTGSVTIIK
jgi:gliding motility-associated-like protein